MSSIVLCAALEDDEVARRVQTSIRTRLPEAAIHREIWDANVENREWPLDAYVVLIASPDAFRRFVPTEKLAKVLEQCHTFLLIANLRESAPPDTTRGGIWLTVNSNQRGHEISEFFVRELIPVLHPSMARSGDLDRLGSLSRRELRLAASCCLREAALHDFLFDHKLDPGRVGGVCLQEKLIHFLHYVDSKDLLAAFGDFLLDEYGNCVEKTLQKLKEQPMWKVLL